MFFYVGFHCNSNNNWHILTICFVCLFTDGQFRLRVLFSWPIRSFVLRAEDDSLKQLSWNLFCFSVAEQLYKSFIEKHVDLSDAGGSGFGAANKPVYIQRFFLSKSEMFLENSSWNKGIKAFPQSSKSVTSEQPRIQNISEIIFWLKLVLQRASGRIPALPKNFAFRII